MSQLAEQIAAAFADEQAYPRPVTRASEIPARYEAITDAWLADVLCKAVPGAGVVAHRLDVADDGTNNRRRIFVEYNTAGTAAGLPRSVFCKATQGLANRMMLAHSGAILCEVSFYRSVRQHLTIEVPRAYWADYDPESFLSIIVLEDFADNAAFLDENSPVTLAFAERQVDLLATIHAQFHESPAFSGELSVLPTWYQRFHNLASFKLEESCRIGLGEAGDILPQGLRNRADEIWAATLSSLEIQKPLPHTLGHGDTHLKNWYTTRDGKLGLGDWGVTHRGHWSRDLAYAMTTGLTIENRRLWERDLFAHYIDAMARSGVRIDPEAGWTEYRRALMTALAFWTMTLKPAEGMPDMQPSETSRVFISRLATAVDDLEVLKLC